MKDQKSFAYVIGVDVSKAKLDIALPNESLTIEYNTKSAAGSHWAGEESFAASG